MRKFLTDDKKRRRQTGVSFLFQTLYSISEKIRILFHDFDFQIIKRNLFHKAVLCEAAFRPPLEIPDVLIQPDRLRQIEFMADLCQRMEHLMGSRLVRRIFDCRLADKMPCLPFLRPKSKHTYTSLRQNP